MHTKRFVVVLPFSWQEQIRGSNLKCLFVISVDSSKNAVLSFMWSASVGVHKGHNTLHFVLWGIWQALSFCESIAAMSAQKSPGFCFMCEGSHQMATSMIEACGRVKVKVIPSPTSNAVLQYDRFLSVLKGQTAAHFVTSMENVPMLICWFCMAMCFAL